MAELERTAIAGAIAGFEPAITATGSSNFASYVPNNDRFRRRGSLLEEPTMTTIDENREEEFSDRRPFVASNAFATETPVSPVNRSTSLLRKFTTKLRSSGSGPRSRPSQRAGGYANIHDANNDIVPVDLSTLEGLGIELREVPATPGPSNPSEYQVDTTYRGATANPQAPPFSDFRRRTLGYGMVVGAQLQSRPSIQSHAAPMNEAKAIEDSVKRLHTVRQVGRNLAEEKGQMVAYNEGVDLSSLEGRGVNQRHTVNFDDFDLPRASTMPDTQSYFFPTDPKPGTWKPVSMSPPYIITLAMIAFGLAGFQEYLCQLSIRKQNQTPKTGLLAFDSVQDVSVWWFFVWKYLPTMITITYAVLFSIMDFDIRRLEPYYQLSQPGGASAAASLNLDHLTMFQYFVPFNAARLGQWAVFASTVANIVAATVAPALQNPSVNFEINKDCPRGVESCPLPGMNKFWVIIDDKWSRALTTAYVLVGLILIFLLFQLRRKSGLLSDPRGIAGIASMATKSHILHDFRNLDLATRGDIHRKLAHRTYVLYKSSIWQGEFNFHPDTANEFHDSEKRLRSPHPVMLRLSAGIPFIIAMAFCLAAVPIISTTKANIVPNTVPWLPILIATILKLVWTTFEADVRLMEPFYQLSKGNCTARNSLTLDYQSKVWGWMPIRAALNGHFLVALVGLSTVCLDILSVTIGSFSVDSAVFIRRRNIRDPIEGIASEDETYISFYVSLGLSVGILVFVISVASFVYLRRRHPFLPREPSTIAAVLSFIYSSKMLTDFIDTEFLDHQAMEDRLSKIGKTYALGWFRGRDGEIHCAIDEEPLLSKYEHNKPYARAVSGPLQDRDTYYYA